MKEKKYIEKTFKKTDLNAKNIYQYDKISTAKFYFIPCECKELKDEIEFKYDITYRYNIKEYRKRDLFTKYSLITGLVEVILKSEDYCFSIAPDNIYVDIKNEICIMDRDISLDNSKNTLIEFKAFAAYLLQSKYSYEDYIKGGEKLLSYNKKTKFLAEIENFEEAKDIFEELCEVELEESRKKYIAVSRTTFMLKNYALGVCAVFVIVAFSYFVYQNKKVIKPQNSALSAQRFYVEKDLVKVIDSLRDVPTEDLNKHEKYILAVSYIRSQAVDAFEPGIKDKLVARLSYEGDENLLNYWIYLGRMEADKAIDVAIRISDNQLLLYSYIRKLDLISADKDMSGEVKAQQLEELRNKIKSLADTMGIKYDENQSEGRDVE